MAAGRTSRPRSGLCVVINGNLKQRELTISFFISSPMLKSAHDERVHPTECYEHIHTHTQRETPCKHTYTCVYTGGKGAPLAPRGVDLFEGGKREEGVARSERIGC